VRWQLKSLADLGVIVTGSTPSTSQESFFGGEIPFVTPGDLDHSEPIFRAQRTLSASGANVVRMVPAGAILVCCIGSLGKVGMAGRSLATNQQINSVIFDEDKVWPRYGFFACQRLKQQLETMAPATTVAIVSKSKFEKLKIPLPPLAEQRRIAAILDQADCVRQKRQYSVHRLNNLSQALFYDMFGDPSVNPKKWPLGTIGDLASSTQYGTSAKAGESGDFPILRMGNITPSGAFDFNDLKFIDLPPKDIPKYTVQDGDVLFNRTNSPELVGKTGVYRGGTTYA
jgi:type I restriction enzyme, S subunit